MTLLIDRPVRYLAYASLGLLARILLTNSSKDLLRLRVEVVTPISDWKRAYEAIYLWNSGLDPYSGNIFHEYPISLRFYMLLSNYFNIDLVYILTDIITALLLQESIYRQLTDDGEDKKTAENRSKLVYLFYLYSPLTIISCAGQSTVVFTNFLIAVILFTSSIRTFRALTCVLCALLACNNIYFFTLSLPIFVCMEYSSWCSKQDTMSKIDSSAVNSGELNMTDSRDNADAKKGNNRRQNLAPYYSHANFTSSLKNLATIFLASIVALLVTSYFLTGSWHFIDASYLFVLRFGDLTPNIGIYWYFFTEMFDHFLTFFTCIVQIIAFIHALPLTIALRDRPYFAFYIVLLLSTICQPYPCLANIGLVTSILPQYSDLFAHLTHGLKVVITCITCTCLWPVFWHLWIVMETANANFYFGASLAFMTALIFFTVDLLTAHVHKMAKIKLEEFDKERKGLSKKVDY